MIKASRHAGEGYRAPRTVGVIDFDTLFFWLFLAAIVSLTTLVAEILDDALRLTLPQPQR